jgi:hypothetical protein
LKTKKDIQISTLSEAPFSLEMLIVFFPSSFDVMIRDTDSMQLVVAAVL